MYNVPFSIKHNHMGFTKSPPLLIKLYISSGVLQDGRIQSSVAKGGGVDVFWVRVERDNLPPDRIKHQLVEEGVVGSDESLDVLVWNDYIHLQVLAHLSDYLTGQQKLPISVGNK